MVICCQNWTGGASGRSFLKNRLEHDRFHCHQLWFMFHISTSKFILPMEMSCAFFLLVGWLLCFVSSLWWWFCLVFVVYVMLSLWVCESLVKHKIMMMKETMSKIYPSSVHSWYIYLVSSFSFLFYGFIGHYTGAKPDLVTGCFYHT